MGKRLQQPIRATQPFQLLQQSNQARKSPSSSPTPRQTNDTRHNQRWSGSSLRSSPDRAERKSPSSPSIKVSNRRSPSPSIRRTSSLDTIAGPYLTGQWPRDLQQHVIPQIKGMVNESTQTPDWSAEQKGGSKQHHRSASISDQGFKSQSRHIQQQIRRNKILIKKKERVPPFAASHAVHQLPASQAKSMSTPISIGGPGFGRVPRRQNSTEALNRELEDISINKENSGVESRIFHGITPPDGHRAPAPRSSTRTMETQTPQDTSDHSREDTCSLTAHSRSPSPEEQQQHQLAEKFQHLHTSSSHTTGSTNLHQRNGVPVPSETDTNSKESGVSPCPKFASSPRPNNSYMFKREPPEGAESVKAYKDQDIQPSNIQAPCCPDINKIQFLPTEKLIPSRNSAFAPLPIKNGFKRCDHRNKDLLGEERNNNSPITNGIAAATERLTNEAAI